MNNILLLLKIIISPILCVLCIYFIIDDLSYYPLSFGLIIGLVNWYYHKYNPFLGVILSLIVSYITFFIAYFSLLITGEIFNFLSDLGHIIALIISAFIIAPLLVFFAYKFVFNYPKTKLTIYIILFSVILLVLQAYFFFNYDDFILTDLNKSKIVNPFTIWQVIMALSLQLIITQRIKKEKNLAK